MRNATENRACANETSPSRESGWSQIFDWCSCAQTADVQAACEIPDGSWSGSVPTDGYRGRDGLFVRRMGHQLLRQIILVACRSRQHVNRSPHSGPVVGEGLANVDLELGEHEAMGRKQWETLRAPLSVVARGGWVGSFKNGEYCTFPIAPLE